MSDDQDLAAVRTAMEGVLAKARDDEGYLAQLRNDPEATLTEAGLPKEAVGKLVGDELVFDDVAGYRLPSRPASGCNYTNDRWGCIITVCSCVPLTN